MRGEKVLEQAGVRVKMIPTPRQISSDCGMALRFDRDEAERVVAILAENSVPVNGIYPIVGRMTIDWNNVRLTALTTAAG